MEEQKNERRRGELLLENLFDATLKLTSEINLTSITFQQIAEAANTSRTVLYRRWSNVFDLLQDMYIYKTRKLFEGDFFDLLKDNGSLRSDLIELLTLYQSVYEEIGADILNNYYFLRMQDKEDTNKPVIHTQAVGKYISAVKAILNLAHGRGENTREVASVTLMLPFDLMRIENLIRCRIDLKRIEIMVDDVLLPVFLDRTVNA